LIETPDAHFPLNAGSFGDDNRSNSAGRTFPGVVGRGNGPVTGQEIASMSRITPFATAASAAGPAVIALHCSGSSGRQWAQLGDALGERFALIAPDLYGCGTRGAWSGERPFTLADEAALVIAIIDAQGAPVHLVGHSQGGAVALRAACMRPTMIASLTLYEPTAFHVLKSMGDDGSAALAEIRALAADIDRCVVNGAYRAAMQRFVDYWNGIGTWAGIKPQAAAELVRYAPKACLDFRASIGERMPLAAFHRLRIPTLLLRGEHAPAPTALIVRKLFEVMRSVVACDIRGAGHMGPFSHVEAVNEAIVRHIVANEPQAVDALPLRAAA
jgi:pimeloyl-ACP methyl ester carboxylesterase